MYQIEVKVQFRYGHRLLAPYEGLCNNVHGEGGTAICFLEGDSLDKNGMLLDFKKAKSKIKEWVDNNWDHAYLHHKDDEIGIYLRDQGFKIFEFQTNPTAENMAKYLFDILRNMALPVKKVGIVESFTNSVAWYEG